MTSQKRKLSQLISHTICMMSLTMLRYHWRCYDVIAHMMSLTMLWYHSRMLWCHSPMLWCHSPMLWRHIQMLWRHIPMLWRHILMLWRHMFWRVRAFAVTTLLDLLSLVRACHVRLHVAGFIAVRLWVLFCLASLCKKAAILLFCGPGFFISRISWFQVQFFGFLGAEKCIDHLSRGKI